MEKTSADDIKTLSQILAIGTANADWWSALEDSHQHRYGTGRGTSMNSRSTEGAVYREAARVLEKEPSPNHYGCCGAICRAMGFNKHELSDCRPYHDALAKVFQEPGTGAYYMGTVDEENRDPRVLALCFMAAMVEAGDA